MSKNWMYRRYNALCYLHRVYTFDGYSGPYLARFGLRLSGLNSVRRLVTSTVAVPTVVTSSVTSTPSTVVSRVSRAVSVVRSTSNTVVSRVKELAVVDRPEFNRWKLETPENQRHVILRRIKPDDRMGSSLLLCKKEKARMSRVQENPNQQTCCFDDKKVFQPVVLRFRIR